MSEKVTVEFRDGTKQDFFTNGATEVTCRSEAGWLVIIGGDNKTTRYPAELIKSVQETPRRSWLMSDTKEWANTAAALQLANQANIATIADLTARLAAAEKSLATWEHDYRALHERYEDEIRAGLRLQEARHAAETRAEAAEWEASLFWELYTVLRSDAFPEEPLTREEVMRRNRMVKALTASPAQEAPDA